MTTRISLGKVNGLYDAIDPYKNLKDAAEGKVILVTGAGRGIGQATAKAFAEASASRLILCALEDAELKETELLISSIRQDIKIFSRALDVSNESAVRAFVEDSSTWAGGHIDVLCCIAGVSPPQQPVVESDPLRWWKGLEVNVNGVYLFARYVLPIMQARKQGHVIFASSAIILGKHQDASSYSVGKIAVAHLAELIHEEMHGEGIRVFAMHPGGVLTRLLTDMEDNEKAEWAVKASKVIRTMLTDDITLPGNSCVFLSTGRLDFMSGRYVDFTIGVDQLLQNQEAIEQRNLFKINVGANWDSEGGVRPFY
ncbi:hypothetical protein E8E13_000532 [Curvularia kusanoi]|uniref:NAD(P)-binding protein n=1 Tax=Curvularia kusanoi TaxID=90978 RepID=A0A9P4T383_CURKU|nr:hypothetical protein E8E13_000532 [Curvularia kusanoi]